MNESLEQTLVSMIKSAQTFSIEQFPDVIQQLILRNTIVDILIIAFTVFMYRLTSYAYKKAEETNSDGASFVAVMLFVISVPFTVASLIGIYELITMYLAPKVFILETASDLIK